MARRVAVRHRQRARVNGTLSRARVALWLAVALERDQEVVPEQLALLRQLVWCLSMNVREVCTRRKQKGRLRMGTLPQRRR